MIWHIITGEYPPMPGGVSDYTQRVAEGLVEAGDEVHVWTRGDSNEVDKPRPQLSIHRCASDFDRKGLRRLDAEFSQFSHPLRLLVQYVPHAYGYKAMNLAFATWLRRRVIRHGDALWMMMHEVAYPWRQSSLKHSFLAFVTELMVRKITKPAEKIFMSTSAWKPTLQRLGAEPNKLFVLPIPSNIPKAVDMDAVARVRDATVNGNEVVLGHFGTYGSIITELLEPLLMGLFDTRSRVKVHLIGGGSERFRHKLVAKRSNLSSKISASGRLSEMEVAHHIKACDIMIQPYGDGPTTRRTSLMACIINGLATVSTLGHNGEAFWENEQLLCLVDRNQPKQAATEILALMHDTHRCDLLSQRASDYYSAHFSLDQTISLLRSE
jgi:glycosyltransferase involved in cell wall biosynthesis